MKILLILSGLLVAFLGYRGSRKWFNPVTIFAVYWTVLSSVSMIGAFGFNVPSDQTFFVVFLGIVAYGMGALIYHLSPRIKIKNSIGMQLGEISGFEFKKRLTYTLCVIAIIYLLYRSLLSIRLMISGHSLDAIRSLYFSDDNVGSSSSVLSLIDSFIIKPFTMAIISLSTANFFSGNRDKRLLQLAVIIIMLSILINGGRVVILYFVVNLIISFLVLNKKIHLSKKQKRIIKVFVIIAAVALIFVTFQRKADVILLEEAYRYFSGAIVQFDARLKLFIQNPEYTYGLASIRGFIMPVVMLLKKIIGFNYSDTYIRASEIGMNLQHSINIGTNVWMKAFSTLYYFYFLDGGFLGVAFFSFLYGFFSSSLFQKAVKETNLCSIAHYGLLVQGIVLSMVRWQFYLPNYAWSFVFVMLLVKRRKKRRV